MKEEELIQKLENMKLPVVELPGYKKQLKQALLNDSQIKEPAEDSRRLPIHNRFKTGITAALNDLFSHQPVWKPALASFMVMVIIALAIALPLTLLGEKTISAEQISANAILAASKVSTVKEEIAINGTLEITGGSQAGLYSTSGQASSIVDYKNNKQFTSINITVNMPGTGQQEQASQIYLIDGWIYSKMTLPGGGETWTRMKNPGIGSELTRQTDLLKTAQKVTLVGTEKVDGIECYVIQIDADIQKVQAWLSQSILPAGLNLNALNSQSFKSLVFKQWIAKDSFLPIKATEDVVMDTFPVTGSPSGNDFKQETSTIHQEETFYDQNQPVTIELPPEAQNAPELPAPP